MEIKNYTKRFKDKTIFQNFNLNLNDGEVTAILGNSGVGKTTLLNALAGLDLEFDGQIDRRPCAYIFQEPRLLKGATVFQNIFLACHNNDTAAYYLNAVELGEHGDKYPKQLSGGMAQRVSMARAFASERPVLLMDEPFSSLDIGLKYRLFDTFRTLWSKTRPTTVFITHNPDEALELCNRIVVLKGSPATVVLDVDVTNTPREEVKRELVKILTE